MEKLIKKYESILDGGYCTIHMNLKEEVGIIKYYDSEGRRYFTEEFPDRALKDIYVLAEEWAVGKRTLFQY